MATTPWHSRAIRARVSTFLEDPKAHGRIETRTAVVSTHVDWLQEQHQWPGLQAIAKVTRIRETADKTSSETAYYLLSQPLAAERFNSVARAHRGVENSLHWCLDVVMEEDWAGNRMDNGPQNLAVLRHMALNVVRKDPRKASHGKFKIAAWNNDYLVNLLSQF